MTVMSTPSDPQAAALLAHVISQLQQNVNFLASQDYISSSDAAAILAKLPSSVNSISRTANVPAPRNIPQPPSRTTIRARALWAYNENGEEADDLSFSEGDIIEIVAKTNNDWWMGKFNGKQALFPSNYVEPIDNASPTVQEAGRSLPPAQSRAGDKPAYKPFKAAHHGEDAPPAAGVNSVGLQQAPGQEEKKNKFGKYKSTLAHSAAGGVGFGAGAAIGGGLVRAIF